VVDKFALVEQEEKLEDNPLRYERFVSLFARIHDNLFSYIFSLLPHWSDAEDVFQQTSLILWRKFGEFRDTDKDGEFLTWACRVAFFEVKNFRRTAGRDRLTFDNDLVERLAGQCEISPQRTSRRRDFLMDCIAKLTEKQRELLTLAYGNESSIRQLAEQMNRSPQTVYNRLNMIRRSLFECVEEAARQSGTE